jgi:hypothetical protein
MYMPAMAAGTRDRQRDDPAQPGHEPGHRGEPDVGGDEPPDRLLAVAARRDEVFLGGLDGGGERPDPRIPNSTTCATSRSPSAASAVSSAMTSVCRES